MILHKMLNLLRRTLTMITKMFGNFWTNVVLVVNFWSFKEIHAEERRAR